MEFLSNTNILSSRSTGIDKETWNLNSGTWFTIYYFLSSCCVYVPTCTSMKWVNDGHGERPAPTRLLSAQLSALPELLKWRQSAWEERNGLCKDQSVHDFHVNVYVMSLLAGRIIAIRCDILLFSEELLLHLMNIPVVLTFQNGTSFFILEKKMHFLLLYK